VNSILTKTIQKLLDNKKLIFHLLDKLPFPFELFSSNGTMVFTNQAWLELNKIPDARMVIERYNILNDPAYNSQKSLKEGIDKAFHGETSAIYNISIPVQNLIDLVSSVEKPFEKVYADAYIYPLMENEKPLYVVFISLVKNIFQGRQEIVLAKEYMQKNWLHGFDLGKIAESSGLSLYHFSRLFKKNTGITPYIYYKQVKINKLKEKLLDPNLSISEAFSACGLDYNGNYRQLFKQIAGATPAKYRNDNLVKRKKQ